MAYNKVVYGSKVLIDLTGDTITADKLSAGVTAHDKSGAALTGTNTFDSDTQDATAAVAEILTGKTAYARGAKLTGTMPNNAAVSGEIVERDGEYAVPMGFHDGSGKVGIGATEKAKLVPGNIKQGITVLGVEGTYGGEAVTTQNKTVTPAIAEQTVLPDDGFDYLASVVVAAIPYTETPNAAGGMTVTIGA
jgi:hypothetical protein